MKRTVNFDDRREVADWLSAMLETSHALGDIASEATRPRRARTVSRAYLRRELDAALGELRALCRAGRRGIRAS